MSLVATESKKPSNLQEDSPTVMRSRIKGWKIVDYSKEDWCNLFKDKPLKFRQGRRAYAQSPHWEHLCESKEMTLQEFFEFSSQNSEHWLYYDYKYLRDVFPDHETFIDEIRWSDLGLDGLDRGESALWIGNKGAHTPCHKDTYGYNVVAQLFGRKLWILMPPEESERLEPVRVPYEESSVYSGCNFFTPNNNLLRVREAYKVVLCPGDVLYVPRHWWHYVENLEAAISTNIWVPLAEDDESRLEEALVRHYVSNICQDLTEEESKRILNPNEHGLIGEPCTLTTVEKCLENYRKRGRGNRDEIGDVRNELRDGSGRPEKLDVEAFIEERSGVYGYDPSERRKSETELSNRFSLAKALINAYCQPSNIAALKNSLLKR